MKIAIPSFKNRVSPRFDCAITMVIVTVEGKEIREEKEIETSQLNIFEKVTWITDIGVLKVICGGIDEFSLRLLNSHGIDVVSFVRGTIEQVLELFIKGELTPDFVVEQCCGRKHRFRGGRGKFRI